ncbi:hypothetical protein BCR43DRAFT_448386, partial [Syncephalastrum racemosum]
MAENEEEFEESVPLVWTLKSCSPEQVTEFIAIMQQESKKVGEAAKKAGINLSTAYRLYREWTNGGGEIMPGYKPASKVQPAGNNRKLTAEHSLFLEQYVEQNPTCYVKDAAAELCKAFNGLSISDSAVHQHLTNKLSFTLTRTRAIVSERNAE